MFLAKKSKMVCWKSSYLQKSVNLRIVIAATPITPIEGRRKVLINNIFSYAREIGSLELKRLGLWLFDVEGDIIGQVIRCVQATYQTFSLAHGKKGKNKNNNVGRWGYISRYYTSSNAFSRTTLPFTNNALQH